MTKYASESIVRSDFKFAEYLSVPEMSKKLESLAQMA
jgi:hypothetical protein